MMEGAPLYSFNIEELYDYDLPNIRRPSEALTAMASQPMRLAAGRPAVQPTGAPVDVTEDETPEELSGEARLTNGDEAANFFARNGNHTPVKFVYLNRARTGDEFRPYDLAVVSREQTDPEYFTMSACGVVHVFAGEPGKHPLPSEFIQLSTWMQESTFFNVLTSIRFFKHYLAAKIFRLWRANVRYKLYVAQRNKLCKKLFLSKPAFCSTLLEINALCYELRTGDKTRLISQVSPNFVTIGARRRRLVPSPQPAPPSPAPPPPPLSPRLRCTAAHVCARACARVPRSRPRVRPRRRLFGGAAAAVPARGEGVRADRR